MSVIPRLSNWPDWIVPLIVAIGSMFFAYSHNDKDLTARVAVLEAHRTDDTTRLDRIEHKIDQLIGGLIYRGSRPIEDPASDSGGR